MNANAAARNLGSSKVAPVGLGCMNVAHAYNQPLSDEAAGRLFLGALDQGYDHLDSAVIYGRTRNERIIGQYLSSRRRDYTLASKCGIFFDDGVRVVDSRPERLINACEGSLKRLKTDHIDLYYLHRWDKKIPVEEAVGGLSRLVEAGKIGAIGLSEVSAATLEKAHATHPIAALQNEYSLWTRNPEIASLERCKALGVAFVAFSPLGRGFLSAKLRNTDAMTENDMRRAMPRFVEPNFSRNLRLLGPLVGIAAELGCTPAQASLAWMLNKHDHLVAIPGSQNAEHIAENFAAAPIALSADAMQKLEDAINAHNVAGARYTSPAQESVDTEEFS